MGAQVRGAVLAALLLLAIGPARADGLDMTQGGQIEVTARDGIEWRQNEQMVVARGDARAVRGDVQVMADVLVARYRKKTGTGTPGAQTVSDGGSSPVSSLGAADTGNNEIYRLEADGHVKIFNTTDIAVGDHAVYDLDQAVVVLTGKGLSLTTPNQVVTARDTLEYYSQKHMSVGRGLATIVTSDGRRLSGDTLVAYTTPNGSGGGARPATPPKPGADPLSESGGKLQRVEAFGHVEARNATETITGDRAVYVADTQMARIVGDVRVTRGQDHATGAEALVNMRTGVYDLLQQPGRRVQGLIVPNQGPPGSPGSSGAPGPSGAPGAPGPKPP